MTRAFGETQLKQSVLLKLFVMEKENELYYIRFMFESNQAFPIILSFGLIANENTSFKLHKKLGDDN